ncbi:hypothetical protein BLNAU_4270 [Blattamonas nauphoetae]|uniref:Uncharacterized protein n=1 Tax=Blattamonas nauphoetae TaxID=2049346 RepID=A0ABQ9YAR4_9EUKA|nr:hypothetical protein BLNAU_4270 [Blattamonas nauphoetae]
MSTLGTHVQSLQNLLSRKQQYAQSEQEISMKYTTQGDSAAKEENFDEADTLADAIEQLIVRLAAMQDSKTQIREVFHTLNLKKAMLPTNKQKRHLLTATFSFHNVLFTFVEAESAILTKKRSFLSTASQQLQHHFREQLRVSTAEEGAEDPLHAAEALVKTKEAGRDEMMHQSFSGSMTQLAQTFSTLSLSNATPHCPAAGTSNAFSIISIVVAAVAFIWFILQLISPERKLLLPIKKWFVVFHVAEHALNVVIFIFICIKNPAGKNCYHYYNANYLWVRVLLAITSAVCAVTGILVLLPIYSTILVYLNLLANGVNMIFLMVHLFGCYCSGSMTSQWNITQNVIALALLPTLNFLALLMINFQIDMRTIRTNMSNRN